MRILGLDIGTKRIGVAVSDDMAIIANGRETLERKGLDEDLKAISDISKKEKVQMIVVGLPKNMDGSIGIMARDVMDFASQLGEFTGLPVKLWDERLSTVEAEKLLISADVSRKKRKKVIDKLAATIILQSFLNSRREDLL